MFRCRGWERYSRNKKSHLSTLEHVKDVKVHTTYFLHVEASTKAWVYFFSITTIFLCTFIAVPPTAYWIQTLWLLLGSSFVKPATKHSSYLLALHMFGNHLYMCADWWRCYIQRLGLDEHPLDKSTLVYVRERIATFLMEQVITMGEQFHDENVWAQIIHGD
jgi:hypothetical protein